MYFDYVSSHCTVYMIFVVAAMCVDITLIAEFMTM